MDPSLLAFCKALGTLLFSQGFAWVNIWALLLSSRSLFTLGAGGDEELRVVGLRILIL